MVPQRTPWKPTVKTDPETLAQMTPVELLRWRARSKRISTRPS